MNKFKNFMFNLSFYFRIILLLFPSVLGVGLIAVSAIFYSPIMLEMYILLIVLLGWYTDYILGIYFFDDKWELTGVVYRGNSLGRVQKTPKYCRRKKWFWLIMAIIYCVMAIVNLIVSFLAGEIVGLYITCAVICFILTVLFFYYSTSAADMLRESISAADMLPESIPAEEREVSKLKACDLEFYFDDVKLLNYYTVFTKLNDVTIKLRLTSEMITKNPVKISPEYEKKLSETVKKVAQNYNLIVDKCSEFYAEFINKEKLNAKKYTKNNVRLELCDNKVTIQTFSFNKYVVYFEKFNICYEEDCNGNVNIYIDEKNNNGTKEG